MLAQNFKKPAELGITDAEFDALFKTLGLLEREEIPNSLFNIMGLDTDGCSTPGCILGWGKYIARDRQLFKADGRPHNLGDLFCTSGDPASCAAISAAGGHAAVTPDRAAIALRNYLTHGEPRWAEALAA